MTRNKKKFGDTVDADISAIQAISFEAATSLLNWRLCLHAAECSAYHGSEPLVDGHVSPKYLQVPVVPGVSSGDFCSGGQRATETMVNNFTKYLTL